MSMIHHSKPVAKIHVDLENFPVDQSAWVEILSATLKPTSAITIFNGSGSVLKLSKGAAGLEDASELPYFIVPGSNAILLPFEIPKGARLSLKAQDGTADMGSFVINCFG